MEAMKTNKFLGLVGTAGALFAVFSIACAAPAVQHSSGDSSGDDSKSDTSSSSTPTTTTPTQPVTSTATTTGTTTTTNDAGKTTPAVPAIDWCGKLNTCADTADVDTYVMLGFLGTAVAGNQTACQVAYVTCKANLFQSNCNKLSDCCDEMVDNGNAALSNACRTKANAGDSDACNAQLSSYEGDGRCN